MSRSYELNTTAAMRADDKNNRLDATGEYIGTFLYVIARKARSGTDGVELHFVERATKREAKITLWTHKADGEPLSGFNTLQALMTCFQLRNIRAVPQRVELYDAKTKAKQVQEVDVYPDLMNRPIGLLLQRAPEEYRSDQGELKVANKLELYAAFQPDTRLVASEILQRTQQPEKLDKMKAGLKDRPLKHLPAGQAGGHGPAPTGFDDDDMDIPF